MGSQAISDTERNLIRGPGRMDTDETTFTDYTRDPKAKIPGTKMVYAGLKDEQRMKDLTAYLKQFDTAGKKTP
jgi:cytochrome c2